MAGICFAGCQLLMKTYAKIFRPRVTGLIFAFCAGLSASGANAITREEIRDKVFISVQNGLSSAAGQALVQAGARIASGSEALASLLRERQNIVESMKPLQEKLAVAIKKSGIKSEQAVAEIKVAIDQSQKRVADLDIRLGQEFPEFKELINPSALSREEVQKHLLPNESLILTFTDDDNVYVWAISKTGASWHRADIGKASLSEQVKLLRSYLSGSGPTRSAEALDSGFVASVAPFERAIAFGLYQKLLAPLEPVFGGSDHVMLVVDGPLTSLPFSVFVTEPPLGEDTNANDLQATGWMIKKHALTTLPSVSSLQILRRSGLIPRIKSDTVPFHGFGDPLLGYRQTDANKDASDPAKAGETQGHTRGVYDDVTKVAELKSLPNTAKELRALAEVMGADASALTLGVSATETAVKSADLSYAPSLSH